MQCFDPDGTLIGKVRVPEAVANVCFGGPHRNRLFITRDDVAVLRLPAPARGEDVLAPDGPAPAPRVEPGARERIRAARARSGRRLAVLDDDPTGSQAVHGVTVVTSADPEVLAAGLAEPGATCFVLTNTRSLPEAEAVALTREVGPHAARARDAGGRSSSRSDSTLRGHVVAEVEALDAVRREATGRGYDGVLLVPAYLEAGRATAGDVHWARVDGDWRPVGETEFAADATFGYAASDLREFVEERSGGAIAAADVASLSLPTSATAGRPRVAEVLRGVHGGGWVVVNATEYADLEVVVLGLLEVEAEGRAFLYRTGPSFVRALAGIEPRGTADLRGAAARARPCGRPRARGRRLARRAHEPAGGRRPRSAAGSLEVELDVAASRDPARATRTSHGRSSG